MTGNHGTVRYCFIKWFFMLLAKPAVTEANQLASVSVEYISAPRHQNLRINL